MHAFGLEIHDYRAAETTAGGPSKEPADTWAIHAVAHGWKWKGAEEGITGCRAFRPIGKQTCSCGPSMVASALFLIERGASRRSSISTTSNVRGTPSGHFSILWMRLRFSAPATRGVGVGDRWHGWRSIGSLMSTNMCCLQRCPPRHGGGGLKDRAIAEKLDRSIGKRYVGESRGTNRDITRQVGKQSVRAITAFADGNFTRTVDLLLPLADEIGYSGQPCPSAVLIRAWYAMRP